MASDVLALLARDSGGLSRYQIRRLLWRSREAVTAELRRLQRRGLVKHDRGWIATEAGRAALSGEGEAG